MYGGDAEERGEGFRGIKGTDRVGWDGMGWEWLVRGLVEGRIT